MVEDGLAGAEAGGGWGSEQAMGLEAARLLGLGPPVEAVRPFLCSWGGGGGSIAAMLVAGQVHEVRVKIFNSFFICIFKLLIILINVLHLFFTEFVEKLWSKGRGGDFDTLNEAIRGVGVRAEVGVGAAGAGNRGRGARVGSLLGEEDLFFSMGHVFQLGGHSVMETRQSKRDAECGVGEH